MRFGIFRNASCPLRNIDGIGYASDPSVTLLSPGTRITHSMGLPDVLSFVKIEQEL